MTMKKIFLSLALVLAFLTIAPAFAPVGTTSPVIEWVAPSVWAGTLYPCVSAPVNWGTANSWDASAGHACPGTSAAAPLNSDTVIFTAANGNTVTVNTTTCVAKNVTFQSSNNRIVFTASQKLTSNGSVTFITGMSVTGTGTLAFSGAATWTTAGITFPGAFYFATSGALTLNGNAVITGAVTAGTAATINKTTTETFTCNGGITTVYGISGTSTLVIGGGAINIGQAGGTGYAATINLTISPNASNVTLTGLYYGTGTLLYTAGSKTFSAGTKTLNLYTATVNTTGISWYNVSSLSTPGTITLGSDFTATNNFTVSPSGNLTFAGAYSVYLNNMIIVQSTANITITLSGTLTCTGTITIGSTSTGAASALVFAGAYNLSCANLKVYTGAGNYIVSFVAGQSLTVTDSLYLEGNAVGALSVISASAGSKTNLIYSGIAANSRIALTTLTDINASGSSIPIDDWYGTVTSCTNIYAVTSANIARDIFGVVP
jgi:hypothetical protein